uniref:Uncharacterized protein n=1 Tax=Cuerna arida TaxID=1464854 RepID=A0A1B6FHX6_9HEMI
MCSCSVFRFVVGVVTCALVFEVSNSHPIKGVQLFSIQYYKDDEAPQDVTPTPRPLTDSSDEPGEPIQPTDQDQDHDQESMDDRQKIRLKLKDIISRFRRSLNDSDLQVHSKSSCGKWGQPQILPTPCSDS